MPSPATDQKRTDLLDEIKKHPEKHQHEELQTLTQCCFIDGAIDLVMIDAHQQYAPVGYNSGVRCDVRSGPCSCGAWHKYNESSIT